MRSLNPFILVLKIIMAVFWDYTIINGKAVLFIIKKCYSAFLLPNPIPAFKI